MHLNRASFSTAQAEKVAIQIFPRSLLPAHSIAIPINQSSTAVKEVVEQAR
jgi:hypothetical protein